MTWFAFHGLNGGKAIDLAGTQEKQAVLEGFHGYSAEQAAEQHPNTVNWVTRYLAETWISDYNAAVRSGSQPGGPNDITTPGGVWGALMQSSGLGAVGEFVKGLGQASTWLRIGEGVLGLVLIAVGVARITNAVPVATKIAKAVR
jgi:hypothetical protein